MRRARTAAAAAVWSRPPATSPPTSHADVRGGQPDHPSTAPRERTIDKSCLAMPTEADGVVVVSSVGRSGRLAYCSNDGREQLDVAAPGGDRREGYGTPHDNQASNRILAAHPKNVGIAEGTIDPVTGDVVPQPNRYVVRSRAGSAGCSCYQYIQGTSGMREKS